MGGREGEGPKQFSVGFRGYQREPVDEYVERLHQWLVDSEARAENAIEDATAAVGNRAAEILRAAVAVGEQARQDAEAVKAAAVENAQREADRMMEEAHRQIEALQQSINTLAVRRANVVSELGRLQKYLAAAAPDAVARDLVLDDDGDVLDDTDDTLVPMTATPDVPAASKNGDRSAAKSA